MEIFIGNLPWILLNLSLALVPIILTILLRNRFKGFIWLLLFFLWFVFLPNTIYLVTDLQYLPKDLLAANVFEQVALLLQFVCLAFIGIISFLFCLEPLERMFGKYKIKGFIKNMLYIALNFIIAFGVILGKVQRTHTVYLFTDFPRVIRDLQAMIASQNELWIAVACGVVINIIYFTCRNFVSTHKSSKRGK